MFSKLFFSIKKEEECLICYSNDGKSDQEKSMEMMFSGKPSLSYPLISLSYIYNCNCKNNYAHNKCLFGIKKCPTCRKIVQKPNLYVKTKYDYYLKYYLDWIKKDTKRIKQIKYYTVFFVISSIFFSMILSNVNKSPMKPILKSMETYVVFLTIINISCLYCCIFLSSLEDYFIKYWLYSYKDEKCYVFQ